MDPSRQVTRLLRTAAVSAQPTGTAITGERWRLRLADGRRLHQIHPLLVHAVLFGGGYVAAALAAAEDYV